MLLSASAPASAAVRVEKATSDLLIGPDWTMNMDICDSINTDHWQAKDVVKAVKKRLQHKNPTVQFLALTLLETLIKNCGDYVHVEVVERDILQEMIKIIRKKENYRSYIYKAMWNCHTINYAAGITDMQVRNKILVLLDSWQVAFGGPGGKYPQYYSAYIELKRSGVQFPQRSADSALIFTPPVTHPATRHPQAGYGMPSDSSLRLDEAMASEMANLSVSDLDGIRSVVDLLTDMLKAVNPSNREAVKDEIITDLVSQCRSNQQRLVQLLSSTGDEELLGQGLGLNDNLQTVLAKHDAIASGSPLPPEALETILRPSTPVASTPKATSQNEDKEEDDDDDDDDFAQLARRNSRPQPSTTHSTLDDSGVFQVTPNYSDATAASSSTEASSSIAGSALALPDPPVPVETVTKNQDMVDLLSITFSSSSPRTPVTPPTVSNQNGPSASVSPSGYGYPYGPQPYILNQGQNPYNNYVAPWAESHPHPQVPQSTFSYPPPPWEIPAAANHNALPSITYPFATSDNHSHAHAPDAYMSMHASRPQQIHNSFGTGVGNAPAETGETQANAGLRLPAPVAAAKPFVLPNRLFDDLIDLRNPDGSLRRSDTSPTFSATKDQEAIGGRK